MPSNRYIGTARKIQILFSWNLLFCKFWKFNSTIYLYHETSWFFVRIWQYLRLFLVWSPFQRLSYVLYDLIYLSLYHHVILFVISHMITLYWSEILPRYRIENWLSTRKLFLDESKLYIWLPTRLLNLFIYI